MLCYIPAFCVAVTISSGMMPFFCCTHCLLSRLPWGFPDNPVGKESAPVVSQDVLGSVLEETDFKRKTPRQPSSPEEYIKYSKS